MWPCNQLWPMSYEGKAAGRLRRGSLDFLGKRQAPAWSCLLLASENRPAVWSCTDKSSSPRTRSKARKREVQREQKEPGFFVAARSSPTSCHHLHPSCVKNINPIGLINRQSDLLFLGAKSTLAKIRLKALHMLFPLSEMLFPPLPNLRSHFKCHFLGEAFSRLLAKSSPF